MDKKPGTENTCLIDVSEASRIGGLLFLPMLLTYALPFLIIWRDELSVAFFTDGYLDRFHAIINALLALAIILAGIVGHELLHGIFWALFARSGWSSIQFGILRTGYIPYCHCKEVLRLWQYVLGALMPLILLGVIPVVFAWVYGNWIFLLIGTFFTVSAIGDVMIVWSMRHLGRKTWILDHPTEAGYHYYASV